MNLKKIIPPVFINLYRAFKSRKKNIRSPFKIGKYDIDMPAGFALPRYQQYFKLYDKFLPVLAKYLPGEGTIIDVGANIGDTALALVQNCLCNIICIEASDVFFPYLEANINKLSGEERSRVTLIKQFAGTDNISGALEHDGGGTAHLSIDINSDGATHVPLDQLVDGKAGITLLKIDTDGFDFDVMNSAHEILSSSEPILFWENYIANEIQYKGYMAVYSLLAQYGYKYIYIFDNYGNLIAEEQGISALTDVNFYLYGLTKDDHSRKFEYIDVLASTEKHHHITQKAIDSYRNDVINK